MSSTALPILARLNSPSLRIVLASGSPRRKELLNIMGIHNFEVIVSNFAENLDRSSFASPREYCRATATKKVEAVARSLEPLQGPTLVIGADTIVEIDGNILEKPMDDGDARRMISMLSGKEHSVHTAVIAFCNFCCDSGPGLGSQQGSLDGDFASFTAEFPVRIFDTRGSASTADVAGGCISLVDTTAVRFATLSAVDVDAYVRTGEGTDKAGSYGIQGLGGQLVTGVRGCYFNVMGLPLHRLSAALGHMLQH